MFKFLFKYPLSTFSRGHVVLLGAWPAWMLWLSIAVVSATLALIIRAKLPPGDFGSRTPRRCLVYSKRFSALMSHGTIIGCMVCCSLRKV